MEHSFEAWAEEAFLHIHAIKTTLEKSCKTAGDLLK